ncbi:Uncharacterised protein [Vibrio cholerae]|nr:Uncharacterised protein [Vibrio cholerae]CSD18908.1 Uncharacterised protein [Vibrio cholerae]
MTGFDDHRDLFQCAVTRTFANTVDGSLYLTSSRLNSGNRVGYRHA